MDVQSLLFDRDAGWTASKAKEWAKSHGYRHGKVHTTDRYIRIRQFDPKGLRVKRTITFGHGIRAVVAREEEKNMGAKRRRHRSASGKFAKKRATPRRRRAREVAAPVATEAKRRKRRRHKAREAAPVATEARRRKRRRHKAREAAPVATEARRRKRRRHKARETAPVATEARRRKRRRHRSREAPVATESRRRHKRRRVTGQVMEAKRKRRRGKRTHLRKGSKAARRAAAKKGWAKRRRSRHKFIGPMKRGYTREEARRRPRRRHRRAREVTEVTEARRHRRRGRRHHKARMFEARRGGRGMYVAEMAVAVGTGSLFFILADGLDRFLATYNPEAANPPKHKFTSDGAGTLANTLNVASHPSLIRLGAGVGMAALPAIASVFVEHPMLRSSLEGAAVGASVKLIQTLWSNVLIPLLAPKDTSNDGLKKSFIARLYPAEVAAHINAKSNTPPGPNAVTGVTTAGALSGAPADAPAPVAGVGQPDVGPFALQGPSYFPSAVESLRAYAQAAGVNGGHESNRLETGIGGYYYPSVPELWREATGGDTHYGYPNVQDVLTRTTTAVQGLAPVVQAAMPGIAPAQAEQVAVTALTQPNDIPGAIQQVFPDMPEEHRHEFGRRLHQHVHHHHRRMRGGYDVGMPGAPPPPGEMFGGLVEEARRRFPHLRHEHHMQIAGHILTEPHNIPGALRRALPNESEHMLHEHARHMHKHVKHVAEAVAPGVPPPAGAVPPAHETAPLPAPEHAPEPGHVAGLGDTGLGYIQRGISSFGRPFNPVQSQQFAAHAFAQPWHLPGVIQHWMPGLTQQQYGQYGQQLYPHVWRQYQQQYGQQYGQNAGGGLIGIVQSILPEVPSTQIQALIAQLQAAPYNMIALLQQVLPNLPERNLHERARRLHPYFASGTVAPPAPPTGVSQPPPLPNPGPPDLPAPGPNGKPVGEDCGCGANDMFLGLAGDGEAADSGTDRLIMG
jgi:hypothetical protein